MSLSKNIRDRFHQKLDLGTNDSRDRFEAAAGALEDSSRNFMGNGLRNNSSLRMSAQNMLNRSVTVLPSANNIAVNNNNNNNPVTASTNEIIKPMKQAVQDLMYG